MAGAPTRSPATELSSQCCTSRSSVLDCVHPTAVICGTSCISNQEKGLRCTINGRRWSCYVYFLECFYLPNLQNLVLSLKGVKSGGPNRMWVLTVECERNAAYHRVTCRSGGNGHLLSPRLLGRNAFQEQTLWPFSAPSRTYPVPVMRCAFLHSGQQGDLPSFVSVFNRVGPVLT